MKKTVMALFFSLILLLQNAINSDVSAMMGDDTKKPCVTPYLPSDPMSLDVFTLETIDYTALSVYLWPGTNLMQCENPKIFCSGNRYICCDPYKFDLKNWCYAGSLLDIFHKTCIMTNIATILTLCPEATIVDMRLYSPNSTFTDHPAALQSIIGDNSVYIPKTFEIKSGAQIAIFCTKSRKFVGCTPECFFGNNWELIGGCAERNPCIEYSLEQLRNLKVKIGYLDVTTP